MSFIMFLNVPYSYTKNWDDLRTYISNNNRQHLFLFLMLINVIIFKLILMYTLGCLFDLLFYPPPSIRKECVTY